MIEVMAKQKWFTTTPDELKDLYVTQGLSVDVIASMLKCKVKTIRFYLNEYGITNYSRGGQVVWNINKETLRKLYHDDKLGLPEIAKTLGCSETTAFNKLKEYGLQIGAEEQERRRLERNKVRFARQRMISGYQYIKAEGHPLANSNGFVTEHRLVAEKALGRKIKHGERIHHINLRKRDNRIENLAVLPSQAMHRMVHEYLGRCGVYLCGLSTIRPEALDFGVPVFWAGRFVTFIDLIPDAEGAHMKEISESEDVKPSEPKVN
jgi:biotin operon repressor